MIYGGKIISGVVIILGVVGVYWISLNSGVCYIILFGVVVRLCFIVNVLFGVCVICFCVRLLSMFCRFFSKFLLCVLIVFLIMLGLVNVKLVGFIVLRKFFVVNCNCFFCVGLIFFSVLMLCIIWLLISL